MNKKNILIIPYTHQLGSTHTLLEIARILKGQGYNIFVAGEGHYMNFAEKAGFKTLKLREIPIEKYRECTDKGSLDYLSVKQIREFICDEEALCKKYNIDLVIDTLRPTTYITCKSLGIKRISLMYGVLSQHYALPLSIPESHVLYKAKIFPLLLKLLGKFTKAIRGYYYSKYAKPYRKILKAKRMNSKGLNYENLIEGDITFIYDIPEFAPLDENIPESFKYIGAILFKLPEDKPQWIKEVEAKKKEIKVPVVYLSMGSTGTLYPRILDILKEYSKKNQLIIIGNTCEHNVDREKYSNSDNIFLVKYTPAEYLLNIADIVVTHGGRGTIYHALRKGVPIIGIPHQLEQEWNNQRLEKLKLGINVSKVNFSKSLLFEALDNIFNSWRFYKNKCKKFAKLIIKFETEKIVKDEVAKLLQKGVSST